LTKFYVYTKKKTITLNCILSHIRM